MKFRNDLASVVVLLVVVLCILSVFLNGAVDVLDRILPALMLVLGAYFERRKT